MMVFNALGIPVRKRRLACQIQDSLDGKIIKIGGSK